MTRIVAGTAGGRSLVVPSRGTRPTADRVREALFSALESRMFLEGASVLDLYAGSGALGLEALSRGADHVLLVENDARAAAVVARNIDSVGLPGAHVRTAPVAAVIGGAPERRYDLVLADPPYSVSDGAVSSVLDRLVEGAWLAEDALVVVERSSRSPATEWPEGLVELKAKRYGEARIDMARFETPHVEEPQIEHPAPGS